MAAADGAYVRLFSCGGYAWHEWLIVLTITVLLAGSGAWSVGTGQTWVRNVIMLAGGFATYRIGIAIA